MSVEVAAAPTPEPEELSRLVAVSAGQLLGWLATELPITYWLTDRKLRILLSRGSALAAYGLREDELVGTTVIEYCGTAGSSSDSLTQIEAHVRALEGEVARFQGNWAGTAYHGFVAPWTVDGRVCGCMGLSVVFADDVQAADGRQCQLTSRQHQILRLLERGADTDEISRVLVLQETTVRNHVARILKRLDVHSRLEAVAKAKRLGLLET